MRSLRKINWTLAVGIIRARQITRETRPSEHKPRKASGAARGRFHSNIQISLSCVINTAITLEFVRTPFLFLISLSPALVLVRESLLTDFFPPVKTRPTFQVPFPEHDRIAIRAKTKEDPGARILRLPVNIMQSGRAQTLKAA